jgi:hypothetical protein
MSQDLVYMQKQGDAPSLRKFWVWGDNTAREIHETGLDREIIEDFTLFYQLMCAEGYVYKQVPLFAR